MIILIVEDDKGLVELVTEKVQDAGYETVCVHFAKDAQEWLNENNPYMMLLDYSLPDINAKEFLTQLQKKEQPLPPFIVSTGQGDERIAVEMMKLGARDYIIKDSLFLERLPDVIKRVAREIENENRRMQAESALKESEQRFDLALSGTGAGLWDWDMVKDTVFFSPRWKSMLGYEDHEVANAFSGWKDLWHPDDAARIEQALNDHLAGKTATYEIEHRLRHKDGGWRWILTRGDIQHDAAGKPVRWTGTNLDITGRKGMEEALKASEANFRAFFASMQDMVVVGTPEGRVIYANEAIIRKLGYSLEELDAMGILGVHPADRRAEAEEIFAAMFRGERNACPLPIQRKDGGLVPVETSVSFGKWDGKDCVFGISKDLSAEQEAQQRFERMFHSNPALMALSGLPDRRFIDVNDAFLKTLGYDRAAVIGMTAAELGLFPNSDQQKAVADRLAAEGRVVDFELEVRARDGSIRTGLFSGDVLVSQDRRYFLTVMIDITERMQAEEEKEELEAQNRQLQKSESLGRMAAAIAHHFNNQLGVVIGNLELALGEVKKGVQPLLHINGAMNGSLKAAEMSRLMITYLGQSIDKRESLDLSDNCLRELPLLQAVMPGNVQLDTDLPLPGPVIKAGANQMQQILTNLVTNAREAAEGAGGAISLSVKLVPASDISAKNRFPADFQSQDTAYACMEVSDTGCGIDEKDIEKLFDPFYSTRFTGRGMGLAVVLGIVKAHNGVITVESELNRGSVFRVFMPVSGESAARTSQKAVKKDAEIRAASSSRLKHGDTVLLVEDEAMVREMAEDMLESLGYCVLIAKDGIEALEVFGKHQSEIKVIITDLTMPRMGGWATLTALRKLQPGIPVILASGYDKARVLEGVHPELPQAFLGKPFNLKALSDAIGIATGNKAEAV